jgi:hypothetical protein
MLDKVINKHLDEMDALHEKIAAEVDAFIKELSIDSFISDPEGAVLAAVIAIREEIADKYIQQAVGLGDKFAKAIRADGEIVVEDSNNPKRNA